MSHEFETGPLQDLYRLLSEARGEGPPVEEEGEEPFRLPRDLRREEIDQGLTDGIRDFAAGLASIPGDDHRPLRVVASLLSGWTFRLAQWLAATTRHEFPLGRFDDIEHWAHDAVERLTTREERAAVDEEMRANDPDDEDFRPKADDLSVVDLLHQRLDSLEAKLDRLLERE